LRYLHYHYVVKEKIEDKKKSIKQYCFKDEEEIQKLWEVFKVQELTGVKPYINKEDVYRHFLNWSKRQSYAKTGRAKKKESILKPFVGEIKGLKFSEDFTHCEMEDGTLVKLDANKRDMAMSKLLSPQNVKK
jgi:hypothetical protein